MKLTQDVYLVGGGDYGFNLTHRLDCHTYLVDGGDELALVDAGFGPGTHEILEVIRADGFDPARISKIVVTHYHADHVGGAAALKRATGARLLAGVEAAPTIRVADADQIGLNWAKTFGFYPADYEWEPAEVDEEFSDGTRIRVGDLELEAVATPGHCMGHYCIRLRGHGRTYRTPARPPPDLVAERAPSRGGGCARVQPHRAPEGSPPLAMSSAERSSL